MATVLSFGDLGCLNESAAGSMGAGMASFVRAGFPAARGFVVTPVALSEFLKKPEVKAALDMVGSSAEDPDEGWRSLRAVFRRTRLAWGQEMDVLTAFGELGSAVSVMATTRSGAVSAPVYASTGEDLLEGIKHCWLKWLRPNMGSLDGKDLPAVLVRAVVEAEASVELRKRGKGIRARAVFGLPEGLVDPGVSADIYEFDQAGKLERMENRSQAAQYSVKAGGPAKVAVAPGFGDEEKLTGEMLSALGSAMAHMRDNQGIGMCEVCFVSSRPVICLATLDSDRGEVKEIPPRKHSVNLLDAAERPKPQEKPAPVVAVGMFLCVGSMSEADTLADEYLEGVILTGDPLSADGWRESARTAAEESKRRFKASSVIFEMKGAGRERAERLAAAAADAASSGMQAGALIPGIRSAEELAKVARDLRSAMGADPPALQIWVRVMYPSNLFFMDSLARHSDVLAMDLDSLGRLMLGATGDGNWLPYSIQALEKALEGPLRAKPGKAAVMSADLVSTPGLLEFLVRNGADVLCVRPEEVRTVKHIVASVEKRMLLEQGRGE